MATMKYFNRNTPPTTGSADGTYYVKRADNQDRIDTYVVSQGVVKKLENSEEKAVQSSRILHPKQIEGIVLTDGAYINKANGNVSANALFCYADFVDVNDAISISSMITVYSNAGAAFYNENKEFIKGVGTNETVATDVSIFEEITNGIKYVRFSTLIANKQNFSCEINALGGKTITNLIENVLESNTAISFLENFNEAIFDVKSTQFNSPFINAGQGYWNATVGNPVAITNSSLFRYMPLRDCQPGDVVKMHGFKTSSSGIGICAFVDINGNFLSRQNAETGYSIGEHSFVAPANCYKLGFYIATDSGNVISEASIQIGEFKAELNIDVFPGSVLETLSEVETIVPRVEDLEEIQDICYDVKKETTVNFNNAGTGYWQGTVGQPVAIVNGSYNRHTPFIPVHLGDTITLRNVDPAMLGTGAFALIDAAGNYLGRMNYPASVGGEFKFTISNVNATHIGWYVPNTNPSYPVANAKLVINVGDTTIKLTERYKTLLEDSLRIGNMEWLSQMFNRGRSPKVFTKIPCILIWGQSNADGRNIPADLPAYITALGNTLPKAHLTTAQNGIFSLWNTTGNWAFKLITAYNLTEIDNRQAYFVNTTVGGTSMAETGTTNQHWTPFTERLAPGDTSLLRRLETQLLNAIAALPNIFEVRAIIGHQGEGDKDEISAPRYYDNLRAFIAYIRGVVGNQYLPFISGTIPRNSSSYNSLVEAAQLQVAAEDYFTHYVDLSQGTMFDGLHFDAATSEVFGVAVYNKLKEYGL